MLVGRFKSISVGRRRARFSAAARYVVADPLRTSRPRRFTDWRWSSYPGDGGPPVHVRRFLTIDGVLGLFDRSRAVARQRYVDFVAEAIEDVAPRSLLLSQLYLGDDEFVTLADAPRTGRRGAACPRQPLRPRLNGCAPIP